MTVPKMSHSIGPSSERPVTKLTSMYQNFRLMNNSPMHYKRFISLIYFCITIGLRAGHALSWIELWTFHSAKKWYICHLIIATTIISTYY